MNKNDFPMCKEWVMMDNSAITFKPKIMVNEIINFYSHMTINPHSKDSKLASEVIIKIQNTRNNISKLVNADKNEVIFTSGTTHSSNLIIGALSRILDKNDEIIIYRDCHASIIIPLLELRKSKKCKLIFINLDNDINKNVNKHTKIIVYSQINNTTGAHHNMIKIYDIIKNKSPKCIIINDTAQAIAHEKVDFKYCDALFFSGGKIYGPSGIGVLVLKNSLIKDLTPYQFGGGMQMNFDEQNWISKKGVSKWEAGTQNISGILGLNISIQYILNIGIEKINQYESKLAIYMHNQLIKIRNLKLFSKKESSIKLFYIDKINSHDLSSYMAHNNVLTRSGIHCANLLPKVINSDKKTIRVSLALYNDKSDVDKLIYLLKKQDILKGLL